MSEEILINVTPPETRVAVIENGRFAGKLLSNAPANAAWWAIFTRAKCAGFARNASGVCGHWLA